MGTWKSRGLRGSTLEDMINHSNEVYREKKLALIQKIPTPITPIEIHKESRHITLAYFDQKSTVDYIGAVQGIPRPREGSRLSFFILRPWTKSIMCLWQISAGSGSGWRKGAGKALPMRKWIKPCGLGVTGMFWCIIWR